MSYIKNEIDIDDQQLITKFGNLIREQRNNLNVSRKNFAESIGVSHGTLENAELGKNCHISTYLAILHVLGIELKLIPSYPTELETPFFPVHDYPLETLVPIEQQEINQTRLQITIDDLKDIGVEYDFSKFVFTGDRLEKSIVVCPKHGEFETCLFTMEKALKNKGLICRKCRSENQSLVLLERYYGVKNHKELLIYYSKKRENLANLDIDKIPDDIYFHVGGSLTSEVTKITLYCKKHGKFLMHGTSLSKSDKCGCPDCAKENGDSGQRIYDLNFVKELASARGGECLSGEYMGIRGRHKFRCKYGNIFYTSPDMIQRKDREVWCRCRKCAPNKSSKGEDAILQFLQKNNIEFEREKKFNDLHSDKGQQLSFDFYVPSLNLIIEYDGVQHFKPVKYYGGVKTFERMKINDQLKNEYCENNRINLLRIPYTELKRIIGLLKKYTRNMWEGNHIILINEKLYHNPVLLYP